MWYTLTTTSRRHYGFKAAGFDTRYYRGIFQIYIADLFELHRLIRIFGNIVVSYCEIEIYDDYRE